MFSTVEYKLELQLRDFCRWCLACYESGDEITHHYGLCRMLRIYASRTPTLRSDDRAAWDLLGYMHFRFEVETGDALYPFNQMELNHKQEALRGTMHLNAARIAWVRKHADLDME